MYISLGSFWLAILKALGLEDEELWISERTYVTHHMCASWFCLFNFFAHSRPPSPPHFSPLTLTSYSLFLFYIYWCLATLTVYSSRLLSYTVCPVQPQLCGQSCELKAVLIDGEVLHRQGKWIVDNRKW
jgi:hypothetical protein